MDKFFTFLFTLLLPIDILLFGQIMDKKYVLVTGGAGYIGSHVNEMLYRHGYSTLILDNLSAGNRKAIQHGLLIEGDCGNKELLNQIFSTYRIQAVMHFAAYIDVGESVNDPLKYYHNNVSSTLHLLEAMIQHHVNIFIFSSSAAVYGLTSENLIDENHICKPISPYGQSKLMVETILRDASQARSLHYCCLRYFNVTGGDSKGRLKNYKKNNSNLIPIILKSLLNAENGSVTIFGTDYHTTDGTCIRDYIHVEDLATAHMAAMDHLLGGGSSGCYNVGNGVGYSVREVIAAVQKVTGKDIQITEGPRRPGDPPICIANPEKAKKELKWQPSFTSIEVMIKHAWQALQ
jgi:UDP-glucose 4-epimerase